MTAQVEQPVPASVPEPGAEVATALAALQGGRPVLLVGGDKGTAADVILPAALAGPGWVSWTVRYTSGLLRAPLETGRADALYLPPMLDRHATDGVAADAPAYTVSVDAATGVGTGISARDRARTARVLADPASAPADLCRPGHLLPVRVGHAAPPDRDAAAVDLCRWAGLAPVALTASLIAGPDGADTTTPPGAGGVVELARRHEVPLLDIEAVRSRRLRTGDGVRGRVTYRRQGEVSTTHGTFTLFEYRDELLGTEHLALVGGPPTGRPTVTVHLECSAGDLFGATACACRARLDGALATVAHRGGALVYLRDRRVPSPCAPDVPDEQRLHTSATAAVLTELGYHDIRLATRTEPVDPTELAAGGMRIHPDAE